MRREKENIELTRVLLVGVDTGEEQDFDHSMEELASLAEAAHKQVAGIIVQHMESVNRSLYKNTIFALRARTGEAKLQVEAARLQYMLPRLVGMRENLSRQGGTGGSLSNKGAGETKLELDRRKIEHRLSELEKELDSMTKNRETMRKRRMQSGIPQVALVGYTNAGKSTILNRLVERYGERREKTVTEKDMLFATLDTAVRSISSGDNRPFLLADTVGFIHKLPHGLVKAFRSTLEEVKYADLLVQVVDFSDEHYKQQMEVTEKTLKELGAGDIPRIVVYNKTDKCGMEEIPQKREGRIYMAAGQGCGLDELTEMIQDALYADRVETDFLLPFNRGDLVSFLMEKATVLKQEYTEEGVHLKVSCQRQDAERYSLYRQG